MHASTSAKVAFNGWHTQRFPVQSGVFQGSPLSPLLFVLAVQPMSAHARQLATQQGLHGLSLPNGQPSPFLHLHADDSWLSMPLTAEQMLTAPPQQQHIWQLGRYLPFSSFSTRFIDAPARVTAYIVSCDVSSRACQTLSAPCGQPSGQQSMVMHPTPGVSLGSCLGLLPAASASARCPRSFSHQRSTRPIH